MQFATVFASLCLAGSALAQGAAPGTVQVQVVKVGGNAGQLTFTPSDIQAPVGSMVQFQFYPKNHSVAQASFAKPCEPIANSMPNVTNPLWSGFMPTEANANMMATYTIMVNNTTPIWLYCAQAEHCQKGMVAAINAKNSTGKTLEAFKDAAAKATSNVAPAANGASSGSSGSGSAGTGSTGTGAPAAAGTSPAAATGSPGSGSGSQQPEPSTSAAPGTGSKVAASAASSSVSYSVSTLAMVGLLSALVSYAL